jgi:molybdopterin converting factor small subunit
LRVTVLLFSSYAEALGTNSLSLELGSGAVASDILRQVREMAAPRVLPPALVAVNQQYASRESPLSPNDEIAIIPPVAGG